MAAPTPPRPRLTFAAFLRTGHGRMALAASACAVPVCALMLMNGQLVELARPRLLALREALLGREDAFHRDLLDARRGEYAARRRGADAPTSIFAGIGALEEEAGARPPPPSPPPSAAAKEAAAAAAAAKQQQQQQRGR